MRLAVAMIQVQTVFVSQNKKLIQG